MTLDFAIASQEGGMLFLNFFSVVMLFRSWI